VSIASKKRRRWARQLKRAEQSRDVELHCRITAIRRASVAMWSDLMTDAEREQRVQEEINKLIIDKPWRLIFREKRRQRMDLARSIARTQRASFGRLVKVSIIRCK
jgi:hypothetical protein